MEAAEIRMLAAVEHRHWWYKERRSILGRELRRLPAPGCALDIGSAAGGNTTVLRAHGWQALALDYSETAVGICRRRGIDVLRADATKLPVSSNSVDLVIAFDVLEHIDKDNAAAAEIARVLRPGGMALISVPCDMALWSAHDDATGHVRRYSRGTLAEVIEGGGLVIDRIWGWNVLLRPVVKSRRRSVKGSELSDMNPLVNTLLTFVVVAERYLPTKSLPGVSLMLRATHPGQGQDSGSGSSSIMRS
jgi:SAM-dependent methyltransferase